MPPPVTSSFLWQVGITKNYILFANPPLDLCANVRTGSCLLSLQSLLVSSCPGSFPWLDYYCCPNIKGSLRYFYECFFEMCSSPLQCALFVLSVFVIISASAADHSAGALVWMLYSFVRCILAHVATVHSHFVVSCTARGVSQTHSRNFGR